MNLRRAIARGFGWLLTPVVAWAASFVGAWIGAALSGPPLPVRWRIVTMVTAGAAFGLGAAILWLRLVRRSRGIQAALALRPDGTPLALPDPESEDDTP